MNYLGVFSVGETVKYRVNFHDDQGQLENPTSPGGRLETPAGVFSDLPTPVIINGKTGHYGGSVDTTGFVSGQYFIHVTGDVSTAKSTATKLSFTVEA